MPLILVTPLLPFNTGRVPVKRPHPVIFNVTDHSKAVLLIWFSVFACFVSVFVLVSTSVCLHPAGDVLWVFVEPGNVVP